MFFVGLKLVLYVFFLVGFLNIGVFIYFLYLGVVEGIGRGDVFVGGEVGGIGFFLIIV